MSNKKSRFKSRSTNADIGDNSTFPNGMPMIIAVERDSIDEVEHAVGTVLKDEGKTLRLVRASQIVMQGIFDLIDQAITQVDPKSEGLTDGERLFVLAMVRANTEQAQARLQLVDVGCKCARCESVRFLQPFLPLADQQSTRARVAQTLCSNQFAVSDALAFTARRIVCGDFGEDEPLMPAFERHEMDPTQPKPSQTVRVTAKGSPRGGAPS